MIRFFDVFFSAISLVFLLPLLIALYFLIWHDGGSPIFTQRRLGINCKVFVLIKFRTMKTNTESVASHLVSQNSYSNFGGFLRRTKLDELPQLWNVLSGEMSLVGPRPNLENQHELIALRKEKGVYDFKPGITGLAQINNIDMSTPVVLANTDQRMLEELNTKNYFLYIIKTLRGKGRGDAANSINEIKK